MQHSFRVWTGTLATLKAAGSSFPTLGPALASAYRLAEAGVARIELPSGSWHIFAASNSPELNATDRPSAYANPASVYERRTSPRLSLGLATANDQLTFFRGEPASLLDASWSGARLRIDENVAKPRLRHMIVAVVQGFGLTAQLAGQVRWTQGLQCGVQFAWPMMTPSTELWLELAVGVQPERRRYRETLELGETDLSEE